MDYKETAQQMIKYIGGKENISQIKHCMTRVRFVLKDDSKVNLTALEDIKGILKVVKSAGQYQCVVGPEHVSDLAKECSRITGISEEGIVDSVAEKEDGEKKKPFDVVMDYVVSIFIPIMPLFIGGGILKGLLTMFSQLGWLSTTSGIYTVYYAVADGFMYFMPFIIAFLAAKKFGVNQVIAEGIAAAMFYPTLNAAITSKEGLSFLGIAIAKPSIYSSGMYYANNVFAIILAVALLAVCEKYLKKIIKNKSLQTVAIPFLSLVIVTPVTFCVFGPLSTYIGNILAFGYQGIYDFSPILAGFIIGALWQILILFGMHWSFVPIVVSLLATNGYSTFDAVACVGSLCMEFLPLFVALKTKNSVLKAQCFSIFGSGLLGSVVEPAMYGIGLRFKKLFAIACIGGGIGGALAAWFGAYSTAAAGLTLYTVPLFIDCGLWRILVPVVIALVFTAIATWTVGYSDKDLEREQVG